MPDLALQLLEWEEVLPDVGSRTYGVTLPDDRSTQERVKALSLRGALTIREMRNGLAVSTSSFVGHITIGGLGITIEPKLKGMRLMQLLRYTYGLRDFHLFGQSSQSFENNSLQDLLSYQLLAETQEIISRGLHRRYNPVTARLETPRGRLEINALAREGLVRAALPCRYHPRLEDCLPNQALLFGLSLAAWLTSDRELKGLLRRTAWTLRDSVSLIRMDWSLLQRLPRELNRSTSVYESAIGIIEVLLSSSGTSLDASDERRNVPGFLFDMNLFFQRLIGRYLRENLTDHEVTEQRSLIGVMTYSLGHTRRGANRRLHAPIIVCEEWTEKHFFSTPNIVTSGKRNCPPTCSINSLFTH